MNELQQLLERWAEKAPTEHWIEVCNSEDGWTRLDESPEEDDTNIRHVFEPRQDEFFVVYPSELDNSGDVLLAAMQAIEARGFLMNLSSDNEDDYETGVLVYTGEIKAPMKDAADGLKWYSGEPLSCPSTALLDAYINVLEALEADHWINGNPDSDDLHDLPGYMFK